MKKLKEWKKKIEALPARHILGACTMAEVIRTYEEEFKALLLSTDAFHTDTELAEWMVRWLYAKLHYGCGRPVPDFQQADDWCAFLRAIWFLHQDIYMVIRECYNRRLLDGMATYHQQQRTLFTALYTWGDMSRKSLQTLDQRFGVMQALGGVTEPKSVVVAGTPPSLYSISERHLAFLQGDDPDAMDLMKEEEAQATFVADQLYL